MAITGRLVDDKASSTDASSYASDVPAAGSETETHIVWVVSTAGGAATKPTLSGGGLTWTEITSAIFGTNRGITAFRARGTNTAAAVTADFGGNTQTGCTIIWAAAPGVDGTTNQGVVQSAVAAPSATSAAASLAAIGANNAVFSAGCGNVVGDYTAEAGFTELSDAEYTSPDVGAHAMWAVTTDTTPTHTAPSEVSWRIIAVELKAAAAAQTISPGLLDHTTTLFAPAPKLGAAMGLIDHLLTVFAPAMALRVELPLIDHSMVVFSPTSIEDTGGGGGSDKHYVRMRRRGMRSLQKGGM